MGGIPRLMASRGKELATGAGPAPDILVQSGLRSFWATYCARSLAPAPLTRSENELKNRWSGLGHA